MPDLDILAILLKRASAGPIDSRVILAELAEAVPAFAKAKDAKLPEFGLSLDKAEPEVAGWVAAASTTAGSSNVVKPSS